MSDEQSKTRKGWFRGGNRKVIAVVTGTVIVLGGAFGVQALTNSNTFEHMKLSASFIVGGHGGDHKRFTDWSDADIEAGIERMVKHAAIEIDATPEQQERLIALATSVATDLKPVHDRMSGAGNQLHDLLLADTIDRAALEQLRAERLADAELISKSLVGALADMAEVLSPEQREAFGERIDQFRSMRRGHHRG